MRRQNVIFKHLQQGARVQIWLYDNVEQRLEGKILVSTLLLFATRRGRNQAVGLLQIHSGNRCQTGGPPPSDRGSGRVLLSHTDEFLRLCFLRAMQGFDEFMNVVLDDAEEVWTKDTKSRKVGERQSLGALTSLAIRMHRQEQQKADRVFCLGSRSATAQGREHYAHQSGTEGVCMSDRSAMHVYEDGGGGREEKEAQLQKYVPLALSYGCPLHRECYYSVIFPEPTAKSRARKKAVAPCSSLVGSESSGNLALINPVKVDSTP